MQQKVRIKMDIKEFCRTYRLTEDQFFGKEWIAGDLDLSEETLPEGFAPKVKGHLTAENLKIITTGTVVHCTGCALFYRCTEVGSHVTIMADKIDLSECEVIGAYTRLEAQMRIELNSVKQLQPTVRLTARQKELDARRLETLSDCEIIDMVHSLDLDSLVHFPKDTRLCAKGYVSLHSAKTLPEGAVIKAGDFVCLSSLEDLPKKVSIQSGTGICLGGKDMPFGDSRDHFRVYSIASHADDAYYMLKVRNDPSSDRLETEYLYRDGDDWMLSLCPPERVDEVARMTLPQMKTAWQLARRFGHHWAVDATEDNLLGASAKKEKYKPEKLAYIRRICPESVEDAQLLAAGQMPILDKNNFVDHIGPDHRWTVFENGAAKVMVHTDEGKVLEAHIEPDGSILEIIGSFRGRHWYTKPYSTRHVVLLEKMIKAISTENICRDPYRCQETVDVVNAMARVDELLESDDPQRKKWCADLIKSALDRQSKTLSDMEKLADVFLVDKLGVRRRLIALQDSGEIGCKSEVYRKVL
jgi:hypothetical protein